MNSVKEILHLEILNKRYTLSCSKEESARLIEAAAYLDQKMREIRDTHRIYALERIAVMAALELAHLLLTERTESLDYRESLETRLRLLNAALDEAFLPTPAVAETSE